MKFIEVNKIWIKYNIVRVRWLRVLVIVNSLLLYKVKTRFIKKGSLRSGYNSYDFVYMNYS